MVEEKKTRWCKICGVTSPKDGRILSEIGVSAIGLMFYQDSDRYVSYERAKRVSDEIKSVNPSVRTVGVFVNPTSDMVGDAIAKVGVDMLQFHGSESPSFCENFGLPYIKSVGVTAKTNFVQLDAEYREAWAFILDRFDANKHGGTGEIFDWRFWPKGINRRYILAGGLKPDNVAEAIKVLDPFGVDVSSGVESQRKGIKDRKLVERFMQEVKFG